MRWLKIAVGRTRERIGFLWLPKSCDGVVKWLETAKWREVYRYGMFDRKKWVIDSWMEDED